MAPGETFISNGRSDANALAIFDDYPVRSGTVLAQLVFGDCALHDAARTRMSGADWPLLWVQGPNGSRGQVAGAQAFALPGQMVRKISHGSRVVGSLWSDAGADYCFLAGILPEDRSGNVKDQTFSCFTEIERALREVNMDFSHVIRTWFYLDDLLSWYDAFNAARTSFFKSREIFNHLIPASTGIGAVNPAGKALVAATLAVKPRDGTLQIREINSPLQGSATAYRSSFSRAVELEKPGHRTLLISGTASIAPDGRTLYSDDVSKQIALTLDVVEAILKSRGMDWPNTSRAIGYFRDISDLPLFNEQCRKRGIGQLPFTPVPATICRSDLLFEMELDAVDRAS